MDKTMDRMVVEVAVNAARVGGAEAMQEACARFVEENTMGYFGVIKPRRIPCQSSVAMARAIRALKPEEILE